MTDYTWNTLEDAVLAALTTQLGSWVKTLTTYQGNLLSDLKKEAWRLPAVLVMLRQSRGDQVTTGSFDLRLDFTVLVVARQLRGEAAGRRDEGGVYEILEGVRQALWNQDLGLEVLPFFLVQEEPLLTTREFTVYAAHYRTVAVRDL